LCAWGKDGGERGRDLARHLRDAGFTLYCLKKNNDGSPVHPLYQLDELQPTVYA
jgi:hypothetical protein